jgi:dUTP pyrophosphatase
MTVRVPFTKLNEHAITPRYATNLSAGMDLVATKACLLRALANDIQSYMESPVVLVPTGIAVAIPAGYEGQIRSRSGLTVRHGITVAHGVGTIDADYRGELKVPLANLSMHDFYVEIGMRVAQLVITPVAHAELLEVDALEETKRGAGGFGSTGT